MSDFAFASKSNTASPASRGGCRAKRNLHHAVVAGPSTTQVVLTYPVDWLESGTVCLGQICLPHFYAELF